jgi:hypothetical protein
MLKLLKWTLIALIGLVALLFAGGYALSPKFSAVRSTTVAAPADKVYALVADPREWKRWTVWNQRDPAMQITYSGPPSGAGGRLGLEEQERRRRQDDVYRRRAEPPPGL